MDCLVPNKQAGKKFLKNKINELGDFSLYKISKYKCYILAFIHVHQKSKEGENYQKTLKITF